MEKRVHCIVKGKVQGVFFRAFVRDRAEELGLSGRAKNLPDGTVEVVAEGDEKTLQRLLDHIKEGSPPSEVSDVEVEWREPTGLEGFSVQ